MTRTFVAVSRGLAAVAFTMALGCNKPNTPAAEGTPAPTTKTTAVPAPPTPEMPKELKSSNYKITDFSASVGEGGAAPPPPPTPGMAPPPGAPPAPAPAPGAAPPPGAPPGAQ